MDCKKRMSAIREDRIVVETLLRRRATRRKKREAVSEREREPAGGS